MNKHFKVVVGLGKTGLSCVRYLAKQGFEVAVTDSRISPPGLEELRQNFPEIKTYFGGFNKEILSQADEIITSPGVPKHEIAPYGDNIIGDIELFARAAKAPIISITGSNGKSTVTSLVGMMAEACGKKVKVGGNLGVPALDLLDEQAELYVLELSSFQLETTYSLKPEVAVVLNISPDHMDRYKNFAEYLSAKQRIYSGCKIAVINRDDSLSYANAMLPEKIIGFGIDSKKILPINELKIKGVHNIANALAALAIGGAINLPLETMLNVLINFKGLEHRCQWVANINNVDWYNDSKGTNVGAIGSAIEGLGVDNLGKIVLILGGIGKGADFTLLRSVIEKYARTVVLIGRDALLIKKDLNNATKIFHAASMSDAVAICARESLPGDMVLLSPACASFDSFKNFEHRGVVFMQEVEKLKK